MFMLVQIFKAGVFILVQIFKLGYGCVFSKIIYIFSKIIYIYIYILRKLFF